MNGKQIAFLIGMGTLIISLIAIPTSIYTGDSYQVAFLVVGLTTVILVSITGLAVGIAVFIAWGYDKLEKKE